mmetsp:Transcript_129402/g.360436  ORF Transcript_129402/g.360436 Transcript_129402/m.360436 type:complete len:228 (-) Transcript_129402:950-1633(-)
MALVSRTVERRAPVPVPRIDLGAPCQQQLRDVRMTVPCSLHQWGEAPLGLRLDVRAAVQQARDGLSVAKVSRAMGELPHHGVLGGFHRHLHTAEILFAQALELVQVLRCEGGTQGDVPEGGLSVAITQAGAEERRGEQAAHHHVEALEDVLVELVVPARHLQRHFLQGRVSHAVPDRVPVVLAAGHGAEGRDLLKGAADAAHVGGCLLPCHRAVARGLLQQASHRPE